MKKTILAACCLMFTLSSCESFFEPKLGGKIGDQQFQDDPNIIRGLMTRAYSISMPQNYESFWGEFLDVATDNATSNNQSGGMTRMTIEEGKYSNIYNPIDNWSTSYESIRLLNDFLERGLEPGLEYIRSNAKDNANYIKRIEGEAYFLRAYVQFDLLRRFAGIDTNGELKGVPLLTRTYPVDDPELKTMTRASFDDCITQVLSDLDSALASEGLPHEYVGTDVVWGLDQSGRATTSVIEALRTRVLLYAASPAFNLNGDITRYEDAAKAARVAMDTLGITTLPDIYNPSTISTDFYNNDTNEELIFRKMAGTSTGEYGVETRNLPAAVGLGGNGRCNPSQNLVDAFPMANGYPITDASSGYIAEFPAMGRDPRLEMTVYRNGDMHKTVEIQTYTGGNCMIGSASNAGGLIAESGSTRTGYFLRKWVSNTAHIASTPYITDFHYYAPFRKVEVFLNFAEAANEAVGPDVAIDGMTAREAIREVRRRAGVGGTSDPYLASLTSQDEMRTLIRNERRIELCFEDHRFFDIRRWKDLDALRATVYGVTYTDASDNVGTVKTVQTPVFKDYMIYGPISNEERIKCPTITQNAGWE